MLHRVAATGSVPSTPHAARRNAAFRLFLAGNVPWVAWGGFSSAWALVVLQFCLAALNLRGARKADAAQAAEAAPETPR